VGSHHSGPIRRGNVSLQCLEELSFLTRDLNRAESSWWYESVSRDFGRNLSTKRAIVNQMDVCSASQSLLDKVIWSFRAGGLKLHETRSGDASTRHASLIEDYAAY
jgi:hypothetical protein